MEAEPSSLALPCKIPQKGKAFSYNPEREVCWQGARRANRFGRGAKSARKSSEPRLTLRECSQAAKPTFQEIRAERASTGSARTCSGGAPGAGWRRRLLCAA